MKSKTEPSSSSLFYLGLSDPSPSTLTIRCAAESTLPRAVIWKTWSDLTAWPSWSPVCRSAQWGASSGWVCGATFQLELELGYPLGLTGQSVVVDFVESGYYVGWRQDCGNVKGYVMWKFEDRDWDGAHVLLESAWHGPPMVALAPIVSSD